MRECVSEQLVQNWHAHSTPLLKIPRYFSCRFIAHLQRRVQSRQPIIWSLTSCQHHYRSCPIAAVMLQVILGHVTTRQRIAAERIIMVSGAYLS